MKDVKIKLEQIVQNIELYRKALDKDGDMTNSDNKKLDIIIKRVFEKVTLADAYFNDENIEKLIKDYKAIETKWVALNITQMKSLDSDAIKKIDKLKDLLKDIDTWIASYNNVDKKNQNSLSKHLKELSEMKTEGELTIKVVAINFKKPCFGRKAVLSPALGFSRELRVRCARDRWPCWLCWCARSRCRPPSARAFGRGSRATCAKAGSTS